MFKRSTWAVATLVIGTGVASLARQDPQKATAMAVVDLWAPQLESATDYQHFHGTLKGTPGLAACVFRVVGPSFEEMWNHYAVRCGLGDRYKAKSFLNTSGDGKVGSYMVLNRASGNGGRGPSLFLLKTGAYTVTITFAPDPDGKSISGSVSAFVP